MFIPAAFLVFAFAAVIAVIYFAKRRHAHRKSPLTRHLLRPPGFTLQQKAEDLHGDFMAFCCIACIMPLYGGLAYFTLDDMPNDPTARMLLWTVMILISEGYCWFRIWKLYPKYRYARLGMEGEQAVGEELNQLMLHGCRVFHDVPIEYGNVDHVVISNSGVFAVETKMLGELVVAEGKKEVWVDYNTGMLCFPDRQVPIHAKQLETCQRSLSKLLSQAVGTTIEVEPILALPGWFVRRKGRPTYCVINPFNAARFFVHKRTVLSPQLVQQIAHQLDQLCRDVPINTTNESSAGLQ